MHHFGGARGMSYSPLLLYGLCGKHTTRQMLQYRGASLRMHADDMDTTKSYASGLANSDILSYMHTLSR